MENHHRRSTSTPTPDPGDPLEDYSITTLPPSHPVAATRKTSASAPASPRHNSISHSPIPSSSRFLRRPSFPFTLDDPSLSLMMGTTSPVNSSNSSIFNSPASSPRSTTQSPLSPATNNSTFGFPLHMRVLVVDDNLVCSFCSVFFLLFFSFFSPYSEKNLTIHRLIKTC
jgi:hypothetical protein